ncbi:MAG: chorismate mutase [Candidatus Marinimicrobia bacterium]|nr:chorismate mutase [Candidatus Neomarinimicrobiota bacterium]
MDGDQTPETLLAGYRRQIDALDERLFTLISQRMAIVKKVGRAKASSGQAIADPVREAQVRERLKERTQGLLEPWHVEELAAIIMRISRDIQEEAARNRGL